MIISSYLYSVPPEKASDVTTSPGMCQPGINTEAYADQQVTGMTLRKTVFNVLTDQPCATAWYKVIPELALSYD